MSAPAPPLALPARGDPEVDRRCAAALASLPDMTPRRLAGVLRHHPPEEAWARVAAGWVPKMVKPAESAPGIADRWRRHAAEHPPDRVWAELVTGGVSVVLPEADGFGDRFDGLDPVVSVLFAVGEPAVLALPCIAIVGTRRATSLGRELARTLGRDLAGLGVAVASGLALGVDAAAHTGALQAGGAPPLAVVGTGVDVPYPRTNAALWGAVVDCGLLLSEHPPGTTAEPHHFPQRNRVLAAVASAVVVVESHRVGGALITASLAADIGRPVGAVPGSVRNPAAEGTNQLLRDGASVVLDALDALVIAGVAPPRPAGRRGRRGQPAAWLPREPLTAPEQLVLDVLGEGATVDELVGRTGAALGAVVGALDQLDERGLVEPDGPRWRRSAHDLP